ncbi:MAG: S8/S53 family peptidase [Spirochaetales bacterium]|nr:S8/S53 family peptidase [Spirochaetales bacterium]
MKRRPFKNGILFPGIILLFILGMTAAFGQSVPNVKPDVIDIGQSDVGVRCFTEDILVELTHDDDVDVKNGEDLAELSGALRTFFLAYDYRTLYRYLDRIIRKDDNPGLGNDIAKSIELLDRYRKELFCRLTVTAEQFYTIGNGDGYTSFAAISVDSSQTDIGGVLLDTGLMVLAAGMTCGGPYEVVTESRRVYKLDALSVNWIMVTQNMMGMITGGPGGLPVEPGTSVEEHDYSMYSSYGKETYYQREAFPGVVTERIAVEKPEIGQSVDVYILDTVPSSRQLNKAYGRYESTNPVFTNMMDAMGTKHSIRYYNNGDPDFGSYRNEKYGNKNLSDHGIFIAGLVGLLSSGANLHIIEVMNGYGTGTLDSLIWGLSEVAGNRKGDKPFIVNTSLTTKVRFPGGKSEKYEPGDDRVVDMIRACPDPELYLVLLSRFVALIGRVNGVIISAAGNDSEGWCHYEAGYPARFPGVMSVGSATGSGIISDFSNDPGPDGFLAFGGEVDVSTGKTKDGPLGIYITNPYTGSSVSNDSGWALWAGSSFATGIVSGVMASLLSGGMTISDARNTVRISCDTSTGYYVVPVKQGI